MQGVTVRLGDQVNPIGSFTDPEYAQVGLTEAKTRATHDIVVAKIHFDSTTRTIIDGRTTGFCKLIVDRATCRVCCTLSAFRRVIGDHHLAPSVASLSEVARPIPEPPAVTSATFHCSNPDMIPTPECPSRSMAQLRFDLQTEPTISPPSVANTAIVLRFIAR